MGACVRRSDIFCLGAVLLAALLLASPAAAAPKRIVSLDYCADQYVLALADKEQIAAVSRDADSARSNLPDAAAGIRRTSENVEEILLLQPDLVVRAWGGGLAIEPALARFHIPVATLGFVESIADVRRSVRTIGEVVGHPDRAAAIVADMDRRLAEVANRVALLPPARRPVAVYVTPGGVTTGGGTLVDDVFAAAGLRNQIAERGQQGWVRLDLEGLVMTPPEAVVASFYDLRYIATDTWRMGRHKALVDLLAARPTVYVPTRKLACSTWYFVDAVEAVFKALVAPRLMTAQRRQTP